MEWNRLREGVDATDATHTHTHAHTHATHMQTMNDIQGRVPEKKGRVDLDHPPILSYCLSVCKTRLLLDCPKDDDDDR